MHLPGARNRVEPVGEPGLGACRLVGERQRPDWGGERLRQAGNVLAGLRLDTNEGGSDLLRLEHAESPAIDEQQVVGGSVAGGEGELAHGDTGNALARAERSEVHAPEVLHDPAGQLQLTIDLNPRPRLRGQVVSPAARHELSPFARLIDGYLLMTDPAMSKTRVGDAAPTQLRCRGW